MGSASIIHVRNSSNAVADYSRLMRLSWRPALAGAVGVASIMDPKPWFVQWVDTKFVWLVLVILLIPTLWTSFIHIRSWVTSKPVNEQTIFIPPHFVRGRRKLSVSIWRITDRIAVLAACFLIVLFLAGYLLWQPKLSIDDEPQVYDEFDYPWEIYTLNLVGQEGRVHQLGRCPGARCLRFISEGIVPAIEDSSMLAVRFRFEGARFFGETPQGNYTISAGRGGTFFGAEIDGGPMPPTNYVAVIGLTKDAGVEMCTPSWDISLRIISAEVSNLRMEMKVKPGSYDISLKPSEPQCDWLRV